ncbi:4'-phosphopantetheinyl transferase [Mucilaginibacter sp. SG538B]|uniref:4'-phosphopantetheinyl transferase family protein n=1 Tax=Mucilaginibacter sp. SG538B TaxID=2587021 RepID=UPI00159DAD85|nr:4'-phosphopantetheinyl transferase superfamily protein [Mucilaginibacter sp. SG538B]NVM66851.1 4'-phosphopantetheinyl transferase [Mucilaginibacter sp. SG538B]
MGPVKVEIRYLDAANWQPATACDFTIGAEADVWKIKIADHLLFIGQLTKLLLPDEISRAGRYYHEKDRKRFIVSRAVLRVILGKYMGLRPQDIRFEAGPNKKPFVKTMGAAVNYNVSHSDEWVTLAVSKTAVGIDTEKIDRSFAYKEILADNFSEEEICFINQDNPTDKFILLWTRKEAIAKLTGQGLDERIKEIPCLNGNHQTNRNIINSSKTIQLVSFRLDSDNLATLAYESDSPVTVQFRDINCGDFSVK